MKKMIKSLMAAIGVALLMTGSVFAANVEVATYDTLLAAFAAGDSVKLTADITMDTKITCPDGVTIDLNGKTLSINVENSDYNNVTIKNGTIVLGKDDVNVCDGYFLVNAGKTLVLNGVTMNSSAEGIKGYAVFHLKTGANLDLNNSTLNISNNEYSAGYIVYAGEATATVDIVGTTVTGSKVNGIVHATTKIESSTFTVTDAIEHGINRSGVTIKDSTVAISGGTGRGITAQHGSLVIEGNSSVTISDMGEATIELRNDKDLTVADTATVKVDVAVNNTTSGRVTGNVSVDPILGAVVAIDNIKYSTLAEALTAAKAMTGDVTVEIYEKVTLNSVLSGNYSSITFVGKDTTDAEIYLDVQGYITATGKTVNFQDLTLSKSQGGFITNAGFMNVAFGIYDVVAVNYTECVFDNGAYASSGDVTFTSCTFKKSWEKYGLWAYGNVNCVVKGCTFDNDRGIKMYAEDKAKTTDLTVKNSDFSKLTGKPAIVLTYGESVNLEGNTYSSTGTFELDLDGAPNGVAVTSDVTPTCKNDNGACGVLVDGKIYTTVAQAAEVATSGSTVTLLHSSTETVEFAEGVTLNKNGFTADGVTVAQPVAKIGETKYTTLEDALAAAGSGNVVIDLLADATLDITAWETLAIGGDNTTTITINGNGNKLTFNKLNSDWNHIVTKNDAKLILNNMTITDSGKNNGPWNRYDINFGCDVELNNVTATKALAFKADATLNNVAINETTDAYAIWIQSNGQNVAINGLTVESAGRGIKIDEQYVDAASKVELSVKNATFTTAKKAAIVVKSAAGADITLENVNISGVVADNVNAVWNDEDSAAVYGNITVTGGTLAQEGAGSFVAEVKAGDKVTGYYKSLQAALDAAAAGTGNVTVEILSNIDLAGTDWNPVTVSAPGYPFVIVNGNGKTITGLNDMLFAGTWAGKSGLVINDLTIADSTIVNDENDGLGNVGVGAFVGFPQASETVTLKNCHLKNSTVKGGHWTGGLVGYTAGWAGTDGPVFTTLTIDGCSVTGSTITGKGSAGGIIGHGSGNGWTKVIIVNSTVSGNTITSTGSSNNKAGSVMGTIGAAGQPTTVNGVEKTGGMSVSVTTAGNTVKSADTVITTIYGRQGTETGLLEIAGGTYEANPIEEGVAYAAPIDGFKIEKNADNTYVFKAAFAGEGTEASPYLIATKEDLVYFRDYVNSGKTKLNAAGKWFALAADIDLAGENWIPIGIITVKHGFMGNFDGREFKVKNLAITNPTLDEGVAYAGFFGITEGTKALQSIVKNLTIENVEIKTTGSIAAAAIAYPYYTIVENVRVCGAISITGGDYTAGVLAYTRLCTGATKLSVIGNEGSVISGKNMVGGIFPEIASADGQNQVFSDLSVENIAINGVSGVGGVVGLLTNSDVSNVSVKNVALTGKTEWNGVSMGRIRMGSIVGLFGGAGPNTISGIVTENVSGKNLDGNDVVLPVIGANYDGQIGNATEARIGDKYYATFAKAHAAVQAGETIDLLADIAASEVVLLDKSLTINGNGHKVTSSATRVFRVTTSGVEVTLNGVNMVSTTKRVGTNDIRGISIDPGLSNVKLTLNGCSVDFTDGSANDWAYAVNISGNGTGHTLIVDGGSYEGANVVNVNGANNVVAVRNATLSSTYADNDKYFGACVWVLQNQGSSVTATGNTFNGNNAVAFNLGNGTSLVESENTDNTSVCDALAVAKIGNVGYLTLQAAVNAAKAGDTVTLQAGIALTDGVTIAAGQTVELDLNGQTVSTETSDDKVTSLILNYGNLVVKDSVGGGKLSYKYTGSDQSDAHNTIESAPGSVLTVNGGIIENLSENCLIAYAIDGLTNGNGGDVVVNINGGNISSKKIAVRIFANSTTNTGTLNIAGGEITGRVIVQNSNAKANKAALNISGGTFNANEYKSDVLYVGGSQSAAIDIAASVTGGTFNGEITETNVKEFISGGTFRGMVKEEFCAPGYIPIQNADGTYGVKEGVFVARNVTTGAGYETVAAAIASAKAGDEVFIFEGRYFDDIVIDKPITVVGETTETGWQLAEFYDAQLRITADGAVLRGVYMYNEEEPVLGYITAKNVLIEGCDLAAGGSVFYESSTGGTVTFKDSVIAGSVYAINFCGSAGGNIVIDNCKVQGWTSFASTIEKVTIADSEFPEATVLRFYQDAEVSNTVFGPEMRVDTGSGGTGMEGVKIRFSGCSMSDDSDFEDILPGEVIVASEVYVDGVKLSRVAKIGTTHYATLKAALEAVTDSASITLLADATLDYGARNVYGRDTTTDIIIDGQGKFTLTLNQTDSDWSSLGVASENGKLTLKGMTIEKTGKGDTSGAWNTHAIIFSSDVEMENVTVNNAIAVAKGATLKNVSINEANDYYGLWIEANGQTVTMNGGSITAATNGGRGIKIADQYVDEPKSVTLTIDGTDFNTAKKAAVLVSSTAGAQITGTGCNIDDVAEDKVNLVWVDEDWSAHYGKVTVSGGTKAQESAADFVAKLVNGDNVLGYYKSLQAAVAAAKAGDTVTLLGDVTTGETLTIEKGIKLDGNGKKLTSTAGRAINVDCAEEVVVRNLAIANGADCERAVNVIQKPAKLTLEGVSAEGFKYTVNVAASGAGSVIAVNGGKYSGYAALNVTAKGTVVTVKNAELTGVNSYPLHDSNSFAAIAVEAENVRVSVEGGKVAAVSNGNDQHILQLLNAANAVVAVDSELALADGKVYLHGDSVNADVRFRDDYAAALKAQGYPVGEAADGMVAVTVKVKYVAPDGAVTYDSALKQAGDGYTVKLLADVATTKDVTLAGSGNAVTLDLNGRTLTNDFRLDAKGALTVLANGGEVKGSGKIEPNGTTPFGEVAPKVVADRSIAVAVPTGAVQKDYSETQTITTFVLASVDGTDYSDIRDAIAAAKESGKELELKADVKLNGAVTVKEGESLAMNLAGHALSGTVKGGALIVNDGELVLVGGTVDNTVRIDVENNNVISVNGTVIDKLVDNGSVAVVEAASGAKVWCRTLADAVARAAGGDTVKLLKSVAEGMVKIEKAITVDLGGNAFTTAEKKAFEIYANATIKNGSIEAVNRCVDTRKAVELTLTGLTLKADEYTAAYGNPQPITIGGSENGTTVSMTDVTVSAKLGYGIITFVQTELAATNCTIAGYSALYVTPGSENSEFSFVNCDLSATTGNNDVAGNSFSAIAVQTDNVKVDVDADSTIKAEGKYMCAVSLGWANDPEVKGNVVAVAGTIEGSILDVVCADKNQIAFKAGYAAALEAEGHVVEAIEDGMVKVLGARNVEIAGKGYVSLEAAVAAAQDGDEVKILKAGTYKVPSGKNITVTGAVDGVVFDGIGKHGMGGASMTFNNVAFDYYPNVNYTGLQHSGDLVYNNCTFNGQVFLYGRSETFNKCTFNQTSASAYNVWTYGAKQVAFNECTFNSAGKSVLIYAEGADISNDVAVTNCVFNASAPAEGKAAIEMDSSRTAGIKLTIADATVTGFGTGNVSGNSLWNNKKGGNTVANNDITVVVDGVTVLEPLVFAAKVGDICYASINEAINAAPDGGMVELFPGTFDEKIAPWASDATHAVEKSVTVVGAAGFGTTLTGGMYLGRDDSGCRAHTVTVKGIAFEGKGVLVAGQQNVVIDGNRFTNITAPVASSGSAGANAISVIGKNVNAVITGNVIDTTDSLGIMLRNVATAKVTGNTVANTKHNSIQITAQTGATDSAVTVVDNNLSNWGLGGEGRAMRISGIVDVEVTGNVMTSTAAPEEFVKVTGATTIDASANYWNGADPTGFNAWNFDKDTDPALTLQSYYKDAEKQNLIDIAPAVAKIGGVFYRTLAAALAAVQDGDTITLCNAAADEHKTELEFDRAISFAITGTAPEYKAPVITFQNATVTIRDAKFQIPELDARQNATINVVDSMIVGAGGDSIVKSYYNGAINILGSSVVYTMQLTTMGYVRIADTAQVHATWQSNVYGNGLVVVEDDAQLNTAALQLTGQNYSDRDNTDEDRVGKPAQITVDGAKLVVGRVLSSNGADYSYNSSKGINIGTVDGKNGVLDVKNGATVEIHQSNGNAVTVGEDGTVNVAGSTLNVSVRGDGEVVMANKGTVKVDGASAVTLDKVTLDVYGVLESAGDITGDIVANAGAEIALSGGTYTEDVAEWCVDGYASVANGDGTWTVVKLPETGLVEAGRGVVLTDLDVPDSIGVKVDEALLNVAVKFAKPAAGQNVFAGHGADFLVTVSGLPDEGIVCGEGDYLAGDFGPAGKIFIPLEGVELTNGTVIPVLRSADVDVTYGDVCGHEGDFLCGIRFAEALDGLKVAFTAVLEKDDAEVRFGETLEFDLGHLGAAAIVVDGDGNEYGPYYTIADALNGAYDGDTVKLMMDAEEKVVVPEGLEVTIDLNGKTLKGGISAQDAELTVKNGSIVNEDASADAVKIAAGTLVLEGVDVDSKGNVVNVGANAEATIVSGSYSGTLAAAGSLSVTGGTFDRNPGDYLADGYEAREVEGVGFIVARSLVLDIRIVDGKPMIGYDRAAVGDGTFVLTATDSLSGTVTWRTVEAPKNEALSSADAAKDWVAPVEGHFFKGAVMRK